MPSATAECAFDPEPARAVERAEAGERVVLRRQGVEVAAVVPIEDLRRLQELEAEEDRRDIELAERVTADARANGEEPVPWEQVKRGLGF